MAPIVKLLTIKARMIPTIIPNTPTISKKILSIAFIKNKEHPKKHNPSSIAVPNNAIF